MSENLRLIEVTNGTNAEYLKVQAVTYNDDEPWSDNGPIEGRRLFSFLDGKTTIGGYSTFDFGTYVRGVVKSTVGYSMVSILPEQRLSGNGVKMMQASIRLHAKEGVALGALYGFSENYYRQTGFEMGGYLHKISATPAYLPKVKPFYPPRKIEKKGFEEVKQVYERFAKNRNGFCERNAVLWKRKLEQKGRSVFAFGNPTEAYVIVDLKTAFYKPLEVEEIAWTSDKGYQSAVSFFKKIGVNKSQIIWSEPNDGLFVSRHCHTGGLTQIEVGYKPMFRILSLPAMLGSLQCPKGFEISLEIDDPIVEGNSGQWRLFENGGKLQVEKCKTSEVSLAINTLTQIVLGQPSIDVLSRNGVINLQLVHLENLTCLFPASNVGCYDFY